MRERFKPLSDEVIEDLKSYPAIFAYEDYLDTPAKIGWIKNIERRRDELKIELEFDSRFEPLSSQDFEAARRSLDIAQQFEMTRTHWAVKDVDLFKVLSKKSILKMSAATPPIYKFSRQTVLFASDFLQLMGHSEFDRFLVGIGIEGIDAGRGRGGLKARSVCVGEYAVKHMDQITADGEPLALAVIRQAAGLDPGFPDSEIYHVDERSRKSFWRSLEKDGYRYHDGDIIASDHPSTVTSTVAVQSSPLSPWSELTPSDTAHSAPAEPPSSGGLAVPSGKPKVFIVHGRDEAVKNDVARYVERIGLEAVILHEQPNGGRTIIQKFQDEAAGVAFAIILMTPDDVGGLDKTILKARARQNVIFELGFFIGRLGANKVCALFSGNIEKPSDFDAVVYLNYSPTSSWKTDLARELHHAGVTFNRDKVFL